MVYSKKLLIITIVAVLLVGYHNIFATRKEDPQTWTQGEISELVDDLIEIERSRL